MVCIQLVLNQNREKTLATDTYQAVRQAIEEKKQIVAVYNGHTREMCPHVIGTKNGREQALFYQFGGTSSSGPIIPNSTDNWRCIPILGLDIIEVRDGKWHSYSYHTQKQRCVDIVEVEVDY